MYKIVHFDIALNILVVFISIGCVIKGLNLTVAEVFFLFFFLVLGLHVVAICGVDPFDFVFIFLVQIVCVWNNLLCMPVETLRTVVAREVYERDDWFKLVVTVLIWNWFQIDVFSFV